MHTEQCLQLVNGGSDGTYKVAAADTQLIGYSWKHFGTYYKPKRGPAWESNHVYG